MKKKHTDANKPIRWWTRLVVESGVVKNIDDVAKVAAMCKDACDNDEENSCVMHMAAEFYGSPCRCWDCNKAEYESLHMTHCPSAEN